MVIVSGSCHRHAVYPTIRGEGTVAWPETLPTDWCGEWAARDLDILNRPISDLNLSVRAGNCMIRLGISVIGELLRRTGDDLLVECKNFGVSMLNEVREKLALLGLKLRGE